MLFNAKLRHLPPRLAIGAFILNSGLGKRGIDEEGAAGLQQMAVNAYPQLGDMAPRDFGKFISTSEIALGAALLVPIIPTWLAAAGLTVFSGSLLRMYVKTPGLTEEGSIRPTAAGTAIAKDVFMLGAALGMLVDEATSRD